MNRFFIILIIAAGLLIVTDYNVYSQRKLKKKKDPEEFKDKEFIFGISYSNDNNSSFYNNNGDLKTVLPDTLIDSSRSNVKVPREYSIEFIKHSINLDAQWNVNKSFELKFEMPISFYSYTETFHAYNDIDSNSNVFTYEKFERANFSLTRVDFLKLGGDYKLLDDDDNLIANLHAAIKVPTGGHNGLLDDTLDYSILSDGAFESLLGFTTGFKQKKWRIETQLLYNYRAEEFANQLLFNLKFAFSTVPGTLLHLNVNAAKSLEEIKPDMVFDPRREILAEDYVGLKVGFILWIDENVGFDAEYGAKFLGKHTWSTSRYVMRLFVGI